MLRLRGAGKEKEGASFASHTRRRELLNGQLCTSGLTNNARELLSQANDEACRRKRRRTFRVTPLQLPRSTSPARARAQTRSDATQCYVADKATRMVGTEQLYRCGSHVVPSRRLRVDRMRFPRTALPCFCQNFGAPPGGLQFLKARRMASSEFLTEVSKRRDQAAIKSCPVSTAFCMLRLFALSDHMPANPHRLC